MFRRNGDVCTRDNFDMRFGSMVSFMVRWTIAAIPAVIILFVIFAVLGGVMGGFLMSIFQHG
jgi:ABC-type multidrug transport system permease subunit